MYKFVLLSAALVLSASAFPAETEEKTGGFFKNLFNGNLQAGQKTADLVQASVSKGMNLGIDMVDVASHLGKTGAEAGLSMGMRGVYDGVDISNQAIDLANEYVKNIPIANQVVGAGTDVAKMGLAVGLNTAAKAIDTAGVITNKGVNLASGISKNAMSMVDQSVSRGTEMAKKGLGLFKWN